MSNTEWINNITKKIGGYDDIITEITNNLNIWKTINTNKNNNNNNGSKTPFKGIILHGKPGTGKTELAMTIAKTSQLSYYVLNGPDIFQTEEGESEKKLQSTFEQPKKNGNDLALIIIDELDMVAPNLTKNKSGLDTRILSTLLSCIDNLPPNQFIIGLTNRLHAIDPCVLRSGRLDLRYELLVKLPSQRYSILEVLTEKLPFYNTDKESLLKRLAKKTHGFVPSDLQSLCSQIILQLVNEQRLDIDLKHINITWNHIEKALKVVHPSDMNAFTSNIPSIQFSDIFGIDPVIEDIKTSVIQPFQQPECYIKLGITPPRGILLYGPTGTGKTMICNALASEVDINYIFVDSTQLRSKVIGESEKNIATLFHQARSNSPCILFIDQIDMLLPKRGTSSSSENTSDRIVTSFLTEMDGLLTKNQQVQLDVLVIAATNRPEVIDEAVLRPGRFDEHIQLALPNEKQRFDILKGLRGKMPLNMDDDQLKELATSTSDWTGAQLDNLLREAAMISLRENVHNKTIELNHINQARHQI
ncbi:unnamed protein product [Cunninghamella blakesleeana]